MQNLQDLRAKLNRNEIIVVPVNSSNIATWSYNPIRQVLTILFNRHTIYQYTDVDKNVALSLLSTQEKNESVGRVFRNLVLNKYCYTRIQG